MKNLLALFGLSVLLLAGVGSYEGWYRVEKQEATADGNIHVTVAVSPAKAGDSLKRGAQWAGDALHELGDRIGEKTKELEASTKLPAELAKPNTPRLTK